MKLGDTVKYIGSIIEIKHKEGIIYDYPEKRRQVSVKFKEYEKPWLIPMDDLIKVEESVTDPCIPEDKDYEDYEDLVNPVPAVGEFDPINRPAHYADTKIQPIEVMEDWNLDRYQSNALKYMKRSGKKVPTLKGEIEDTKKSIWYLERRVQWLEQQQEKENQKTLF